MGDVERLLREFQRDFEAGGSLRPGDVLSQVEGADRRELEVLIDAYLTRAPRRPFDPDAFAGSPARALVDDLAEVLAADAGSWRAVLPRLRDAAQLRRSELVHRLAERLGVAGREEKVGRYYHAMEQGLLDPEGVSDRVLRALAELLGSTVDRLRESGSAFRGEGDLPAARVSFARAARPAEEHLDVMAASPPPAADRDEPDEVDRLFTGGPDA